MMKQRIQGECFSKQEGYWTYKVCIGVKVTQFHNEEIYNLGNYDPSEPDSHSVKQAFNEGTECEIQGKRRKRRTTVRFMCGPHVCVIVIVHSFQRVLL